MISMEFLVATGIGWVVACRHLPAAARAQLHGGAGPDAAGLCRQRLHLRDGPAVERRAAHPGGDGPLADPLPQALVLTAIVIGFATTGFVIELALRSRHEGGSDHVDGRSRCADDGSLRAG
jgi:multicomponent K+:H+ antiporter subunit C